MKKIAAATGICMMVASALAVAPRVDKSAVTIDQDGFTRRVTVTYTLKDAPGIVTVDFQTNVTGTAEGPWASIGVCNFTNVAGDVNRPVRELDVEKHIYWQPEVSWPDHKIESGNVRAEVRAWALNAPPDYMAVNLAVSNCVYYYVSAEAVPGGVTNDLYKTDMLLMRRIHATDVEWRMGSPAFEESLRVASQGVQDNEAPHPVRLTKDYYIGVYELTQRQWVLMGSVGNTPIDNPSKFQNTALFAGNPYMKPVENIKYNNIRGTSSTSWKGWPECGHEVAAGSFLAAARANTGVLFDMPTDAQWEFACRAGTTTLLNNGKGVKSDYRTTCPELDEVVWNVNNCWETNEVGYRTNQTHVVGLKMPNAWGLYDMHGNVFEWCLDWFSRSDPFGGYTVQVDPVGRSYEGSTQRHIRGGSYTHGAADARSSSRMAAGPAWSDYAGVRLTAPVGETW